MGPNGVDTAIPGDTVSTDSAELTAGGFVAALAEASGPWLVVMDGLVNPADADGLWPSGNAGRVLATAGHGAGVPDEAAVAAAGALTNPISPGPARQVPQPHPARAQALPVAAGRCRARHPATSPDIS